MCEGNNTISPSTCKLGHYCQNGIPKPCPSGTYGKDRGLKSASECSPCPTGKYCPGLANTSPNLTCAAGWFCESGAKSATPRPSSYSSSRNGPCEEGR